MSTDLWSWPAEHFVPALAALTGTSATLPPTPDSAGERNREAVTVSTDHRALVAAATAAGFEPVPVDWAGRPTAALVERLAPGWCVVADGVVVVRRTLAGWAQLVTPTGTRWARNRRVAVLLERSDDTASPVLEYPELRHTRERAATALVKGRALPDGEAVRLLPGAAAPIRRHLRAERIGLPAAATVVCVVVGYLLFGVSWAWAGDHLLADIHGPGWLAVWMGLAAAGVTLRTLAQLALGELTVRASSWARRRVMARAIRLDPDAVHESGPGWVLARTFDVDAAETGLAGGGAAAGLGFAQVLIGAVGLLLVADGPLLLGALTVFVVLTTSLGVRLVRLKQVWTRARHAASSRITEELLEHPSRLLQGRPAGDDVAALDELAAIAHASRRCDRLAAWLIGATAPAWLLLSLLVLAATWPNDYPGPATAAATVGLILLVASGFEAMTVAADDLTDGGIALDRARPLLSPRSVDGRAHAAPRSPRPRSASESVDGRIELEAAAVGVTYPGRKSPSLSNFTYRIRGGEKVLLSGPSGGGKSTAVAVLAGMMDPTVGSVTRTSSVVAVPQHHRNHLFSNTLLFNLLLGRGWPPTEADADDAERICRALELDALVDRMPGGLNQHVGETGWQLSDGERVRVYAARALLQNPAVVLLDESLSALDPLTAATCRDAIATLARTVVLTHHP